VAPYSPWSTTVVDLQHGPCIWVVHIRPPLRVSHLSLTHVRQFGLKYGLHCNTVPNLEYRDIPIELTHSFLEGTRKVRYTNSSQPPHPIIVQGTFYYTLTNTSPNRSYLGVGMLLNICYNYAMNWRDFFNRSSPFKDKKITVMGIGLLGGVYDIEYLAKEGADIIVTDLQNESELQDSLKRLKKYENIRYTLGKHILSDFQNRDLVIKAPKTPLNSPYIAVAKKHDIPVTMWAALFSKYAREANIPIIGVTGTRGKSTVTSCICHTLSLAEMNVISGGNVKGSGILSKLPNISKNTVAVLELDSWKLQGFGEEQISPNIAVFTTFYPDHMDYYSGDINLYLSDKVNIFKYQAPEEYLIVGAQASDVLNNKCRNDIHAKTSVISEKNLPTTWRVLPPGMHNRYNMALATEAMRTLGVEEEIIRRGIETFTGIQGRLELISEEDGIKVYNDTTSTMPEATLVGIRALGSMKRVVLILGGADKGLSYDSLFTEVPKYCKSLILLAGSGTARIRGQALNIQGVTILEAETLALAVKLARANAQKGDNILFSPGFASFGMFKNEYDRGEQFNALVLGVKKKK
jgi:UDP-N-acetylmuramoylalanine--D-glutamate ligase